MIGHIAKSVALVGKGEKHKAYRACDIAFDPFQPSCARFLLLIKVRVPLGYTSVTHFAQAIVVFMAGEHDDAISRLDDLIAMTYDNSICHVVQACA